MLGEVCRDDSCGYTRPGAIAHRKGKVPISWSIADVDRWLWRCRQDLSARIFHAYGQQSWIQRRYACYCKLPSTFLYSCLI